MPIDVPLLTAPWYNRRMQITRQIDFFCREYVTDFDASRAARAAGVTKASAPGKARMWLSDANVSKHIDELYAAKVAKIPDVVMSPHEVLVRLSRIAGADIRGIVDDEGRLLSPNEIGDDVAAAVEGWKGETEKAGPEFKFASKATALKMLGEHHNLFEKHEKNKAANVQINITGKDADL